MKTKLLVGAVAALLYGGVALANNEDCPPGYEKKDTQASMGAQAGDQSLSTVETEPVDESVGGSGQAGMGQQQQGEIVLRCQPVKSGTSTGTGGSGSINEGYSPSQSQEPNVGAGGGGYQTEPLREPQVTPVEPAPPAEPVTPPSGAFSPISEEQHVKNKKEHHADMRGLTVTAGGGVEGYTGALAPNINPGAAYGVQAEIRPSKVFGLELGYTGAVNDLDSRLRPFGGTNGPDLVRNGGQAAVTIGLTAAPLQPYVMGGIGIDDYNFRGTGPALAGLRDDTVGNVPVGVGLRSHIGHFTADLRANYDFLFDQDFLPVSDFNGNGRYSGTLNIGGTF